MNTLPSIKVLKGATLKMQVMWDYPADPAITLDSVDFYVEYFTNVKNKIVIQKADLTREEVQPEEGAPQVNWYAYVQSGLLDAGLLIMRLHADVPDIDAPDGVKVEYAECCTHVVIYE